jgi:predicted ArsR family transcriptional regulator
LHVRVKQGAEAHRALSDTARLRLFTLITEAERPLDIAEMARAMELHPNTIRSHLRRLELVGLVVPEVEERNARGRPRILYKPGPEAEDMGHGARNYKLLANMLAGFVTAGLRDPATGAEIAGRGWGGYLAAPVRPQPGDPVDLQAASEMIQRLMDRLGFEPELHETSEGVEVHLRHCPFRDIAARYPETVCSMHLGILRGALADARAGAEATQLVPFVTPSLCVARLERKPEPSDN